MYYEEKIINGKTYFRTTPTGDWELLSNEDMTKQISQIKKELTASRDSRMLSAVPSRENIRRIIELTASIESDGSTYGMDTNIGDVEDLIDRAEDILRGIVG